MVARYVWKVKRKESEVAATGAEAARPVGTRIAVDPTIACGICHECRRGDVCLCPRRVALGVDLDGGLAA